MIEVYRNLFSLLDRRERRRSLVVLFVLLVVAIAEMVGVASVMPFIAVLSDPEITAKNEYLSAAYDILGFSSNESFLIFLGCIFFFLLLTSLFLRAIGLWTQLRFCQNRLFSWGARLIEGYLRQPYEWFLNRNSSDLATAVLAEVNQSVNGALFPALQAIAHTFVAVLIFLLLLAVDPFLAIGIGGLVGGLYLGLSIFLKRRLNRVGKARRAAQKKRYGVVQEAFTGIKDVKVSGLEQVFLRRYSGPARTLVNSQISFGLISQLPSFGMQALMFGGMMLVILYLLYGFGSLQDALPILGLYALGAYRLMPAINDIYKSLAQVRYSAVAVKSLSEDLAGLHHADLDTNSGVSEKNGTSLKLVRALELVDVSYSYPNAHSTAVKSLSLSIPAFTTVGIVGPTGSGKTTMVDIILGLLSPNSGCVSVDGVSIGASNQRAWQRSLGYVPQQIFLSDDSIAANIAFGIRPEDIDMDAVVRAAKLANLDDFVSRQLPEAYLTKVGERGVRISGGQRQRIGIARALYKDPDVLIFDEATSALDNVTERSVMAAVASLARKKTIIMIAHRLSTVRMCDTIFFLEGGELSDKGTYDGLIQNNEQFREMAAVHE